MDSSTSPLISTAEIAQLLGCSHAHATDRIVKSASFPKPVINVSRKMRRWSEYAVREWAKRPRSR
jgi:predicted DNA-binding transcriptional regulator AlpA